MKENGKTSLLGDFNIKKRRLEVNKKEEKTEQNMGGCLGGELEKTEAWGTFFLFH